MNICSVCPLSRIITTYRIDTSSLEMLSLKMFNKDSIYRDMIYNMTFIIISGTADV